jgi:hypothetical protein
MFVTRIHVTYSVRYYPWFHVTAVGLGTYYPWIRGHTCTVWYVQSYIVLGHTERTTFIEIRSYLYAVFLGAFTQEPVSPRKKNHSNRQGRGEFHPNNSPLRSRGGAEV